MTRILIGICLLAGAACSGADAPAGSNASDASPAPARLTLAVSPETQKKWGVAVGPVPRVSVSSAVTLPGILGLNQSRTAQISPIVEGKVVEIRADLGDQVRKGQVLLVIHSPVFAQAQSAFLQAHAKLALARKEFERATELIRVEAIQQREYLRREAEFDAATMELGLQESNLHSLGLDHARMDALVKQAGSRTGDLSDLAAPNLDVVSPIDGRIIYRDVVVGEHIHPDKTVFTASNLATLWAFLDAREKDLPAIGPSSRVTIHCPVYPDRSFEGRNTQAADVVDEKLRTIKVRVEVANTGLLLKPNMFVQGTIETTAAARQVLAVPEDAIQTIEGEKTVFVRTGDRTFTARPVQVGDRIGASRAISRGLDGSEIVALTGAFTLKSELMKSTLGGE